MKEKMTYALFVLLLTIGLIGAGNAKSPVAGTFAMPDTVTAENGMEVSGVSAEKLTYVQTADYEITDEESEDSVEKAETGTDYSYVPNQVDLYLPSNPTTGYSWVVDASDPTVVEFRDLFFEDGNELGFVGAGGIHWFHISGLNPGTTSVSFRYIRPWEPDKAVQETVYRLTVDDQLNVLIWGVEVS